MPPCSPATSFFTRRIKIIVLDSRSAGREREIRSMANPENPYQLGVEFASEFGRFEYAMKRAGLLLNKQVAEADWKGLAKILGEEFFHAIVSDHVASTLITRPPRKLMSDLSWAPETPTSLRFEELLFKAFAGSATATCTARNSPAAPTVSNGNVMFNSSVTPSRF